MSYKCETCFKEFKTLKGLVHHKCRYKPGYSPKNKMPSPKTIQTELEKGVKK